MARRRIGYGVAAVLLLAIEIVIALFVHDTLIRPYTGDSIVVLLVYAVFRALTPLRVGAAALASFLFACAVEVGQYFHLVDRLGLGDNGFARTVLGMTFVPEDFLAYAIGALIAVAAERVRARRTARG